MQRYIRQRQKFAPSQQRRLPTRPTRKHTDHRLLINSTLQDKEHLTTHRQSALPITKFTKRTSPRHQQRRQPLPKTDHPAKRKTGLTHRNTQAEVPHRFTTLQTSQAYSHRGLNTEQLQRSNIASSKRGVVDARGLAAPVNSFRFALNNCPARRSTRGLFSTLSFRQTYRTCLSFVPTVSVCSLLRKRRGN